MKKKKDIETQLQKAYVRRRAAYIFFVVAPFVYLPGIQFLQFGTVAWWCCVALISIDALNRYYYFYRHGD
jgi:hypothetical protein